MTPRTRARWVVALLMLFVAINFADKSIIGLAAAPMMAELGLSATAYGTIASSFYLLFSISAVAFGFLGNRFSGKRMLVALALVWSAAQLPILAPAAGFGVLLVTRILLGAGEGPGVPLGMHVAFTWVEQRGRGFTAALLTVGSGLGVIIGAPLLQAAIETWGWRSAFGILGAIGLVWVVAWLAIGGDGPYSATAQAPAAGEGRAAADAPVRYRRLLASGTWLGTMISGFTVYWGLALAIAFLPLYLGQVGGVHLRRRLGQVHLPEHLTGGEALLADPRPEAFPGRAEPVERPGVHQPRDPPAGQLARADVAVGPDRAIGREAGLEIDGRARDPAVEAERGAGDRDPLGGDGSREHAERAVVEPGQLGHRHDVADDGGGRRGNGDQLRGAGGGHRWRSFVEVHRCRPRPGPEVIGASHEGAPQRPPDPQIGEAGVVGQPAQRRWQPEQGRADPAHPTFELRLVRPGPREVHHGPERLVQEPGRPPA